MGHFLQDVEITNFKSIRHQKIEGCRRINVFIGYPNVGKSNILEALGTGGLYYFDKLESELNLKSLFRVESFTDAFFDGNCKEPSSIIYNRALESFFRLDKSMGILEWSYKSGKENTDSIDRKYVLFDSSFNAIRDSSFYEKQDAIINKDVRGFKKPVRYINMFHPVKFYKYSDGQNPAIIIKRGLDAPYGNNLPSVLSNEKEFRKEVSGLFKAYNLRLAIDKASNHIRILKEDEDDSVFIIPYSLIADTLKRLIFYKAAIASSEESVLLFEEPEAHMFPPYIKLFTNDIIDRKANQYFLNTHSPFVLHEFLETQAVREELSIYAVGLENGETTIKRLTDEEVAEVHQYGVDLFFNLESYL